MNPLEQLFWIAVGAVLTLVIEWAIKGGMEKAKKTYTAWRDETDAWDHYDTVLVTSIDFSTRTLRIENAGVRDFIALTLTDAPFRQATGHTYHRPSSHSVTMKPFKRGQTRDIPWSELGLDQAELRAANPQDFRLKYSGRYAPNGWLRRILVKPRETWGHIRYSELLTTKPRQEYLVSQIEGLYSTASAGKPPEGLISSILGLSDEEAAEILTTKRDYRDPLAGRLRDQWTPLYP
ncbi:hypothetical protein J7E29_02385 [Streptomyces sp. ISL-90]|nr:hypothetical protein [Streptomyces sp. ISL-90]